MSEWRAIRATGKAIPRATLSLAIPYELYEKVWTERERTGDSVSIIMTKALEEYFNKNAREEKL